jgi:hypothetical protein
MPLTLGSSVHKVVAGTHSSILAPTLLARADEVIE